MSNLTSILFLLAAAGLFFGYINPAYGGTTGAADTSKKSVVLLRALRSQYDDALQKAREVEEARTGLLQAYNAIPAADLKRLETLLPDYLDSVRFIIDINTLASGYKMTLKNVSVEDTGLAKTKQNGSASAIGPLPKTFQSIGITFTVSGSYDNFRSFLRDLEQSIRLADARKVSFSARPDGSYDFSVTIDTYRLE